jgi:hypothetical protein
MRSKVAAIIVTTALSCAATATASPVLFGNAAIKKHIDDKRRRAEEAERARQVAEEKSSDIPVRGNVFVKPPGEPPPFDPPLTNFPKTFL